VTSQKPIRKKPRMQKGFCRFLGLEQEKGKKQRKMKKGTPCRGGWESLTDEGGTPSIVYHLIFLAQIPLDNSGAGGEQNPAPVKKTECRRSWTVTDYY